MSLLSSARDTFEKLTERTGGPDPQASSRPKYPGIRAAVDGNTAVILCEREASDAAGAYPITPSTQMGELWAEAAARGHLNISGRPLIFIEPEGEHAAAAVTAGLAMTGLRSANFSSGQGIAYMHESLYAAVGKRLTYVLNIGARAMTKATLNVHAGHDDYHCIDDTGFFQLFARDAQAAADLNLVAHRLAELALTPGAVAQDGFLTTHLIESILVPERALIEEYLGRPDDLIATPTPAQRILYGETRRRIPELWDVDNPLVAGLVQNQDAYMQSVAAQRPYFFDHLRPLADRAFDELHALTGRRYARVQGYRTDDAEYLIVGQGSVIPSAEAVADYLRASRGLRVGVVDLVMFRPFPADLVGRLLQGKKGVAVLERLDQPLAVDPPLMREIRATFGQCLENGRHRAHSPDDELPFPDLAIYDSATDAPPLYSGAFGLGSRDLQPEGLIAAVENMLDDGPGRRRFYLSIDFLHEPPATPKQRLYQETLEEAYPHLRTLALRGSENPDLMPPGAISVRFHSVGGWGAITTGKNLAMTLFDLLGYHIKANPKYGSEKKGQPTTYYLSASPEPIRVNCETIFVDVVLSPDPNVFHHTNALAGLVEGGVFILQSDHDSEAAVWASIPEPFQKLMVAKNIQLFALDAFEIARQEATDPDLMLRMQGIAFQGAFFAAAPVMERTGLDEERLLEAIHDQLQDKFGSKGARVVADNLRVVRRGFDEVRPIPHGEIGARRSSDDGPVSSEPTIPTLVRRRPRGESAIGDLHRFWEQTGSFYARGQGNDNLTDPFIGLGVMPAGSALFRDMTGIRFHHPEWIAENCTACGDCYTVCPDTAIPGLVSEVGAVLDTVVRRVKQDSAREGSEVRHLPKAVRRIERSWSQALRQATEDASPLALLEGALDQELETSPLEGDAKQALAEELERFRDALDGFQFALTRPFFTLPEGKEEGRGGLFSITVNPNTCKGCMECIEVCGDDALRSVPQTEASIARLRKHWDFWLDLPSTPAHHLRADVEEGIGPLETLLLDKANYLPFTSGDGACLGCSEKTIVHLFTATVEALMRPRVEHHLERLDDLVGCLQNHIQKRLVRGLAMDDPDAVGRAVAAVGDGDLTLAELASNLGAGDGEPIDRDWLGRMTALVASLKQLAWKYRQGVGGSGRSSMGIVNATGCTSVWGSTYPYNPYPFPWANHLFQDSPSMAMGVFEGHMAKMAQGFKAIRQAELELSGDYRPEEHDDFFAYFDWHQFDDDEWRLCPPVVAVGGDGAMYDIGFQNLSRLMASGKPIKVLVVDTQVYSNTGGQACTSGFLGQISDMAQHGRVSQGKVEPRKEIGLIGMAHRNTYVMQSTIAYPRHMIEGFVAGLKARRPALFNLYTSCQPEHGIGDDLSARQAKLVVESRAYPLFRYDPDAGTTPAECFDLDGNPEPDADWPTYTLAYRDRGLDKSLELPMTFVDFAITEVRFRKHFRIAPSDTWNDSMIPLAEFLDLPEGEREGRFPFVWSIDSRQRLSRLLVSHSMVQSTEDRRAFWTQLRALAGLDRSEGPNLEEIEQRVRQQVVGKIAHGLMELATGAEADPASWIDGGPPASAPPASAAAPETPEASGDGYLAPWIDSDDCTSCDDCIRLNPSLFVYNAEKKATIKDPQGGPYRDLVKAAEGCPAQVIHPGLPRDRSAPDVDRWIARGEKHN